MNDDRQPALRQAVFMRAGLNEEHHVGHIEGDSEAEMYESTAELLRAMAEEFDQYAREARGQ